MDQMNQMDHSEAVNLMAAERYLLGELPPDLRDAFEEHMFDCPECAFDMRAGVTFVDEAKLQLPGMMATQPTPQPATASPDRHTHEPANGRKRRFWSGWWGSLFTSPAFAGPVFATLLLVVGYQNLVTYPALRSEANEPRLLPAVALHTGTRGARPVVVPDRKQGVLLQIDLPGAQNQQIFTTFAVDLYNPQGKLAWTQTIPASADGTDTESLSLVIPGGALQAGSYVLAVSGVGASGQHSELERHSFDIRFHD